MCDAASVMRSRPGQRACLLRASSSFGRECRSSVVLRLAGRGNCFTKLPDFVYVTHVVDKQGSAARCPVFAGHADNLKSSGTLIRNFGKPACGVVVRFCVGPATAC